MLMGKERLARWGFEPGADPARRLHLRGLAATRIRSTASGCSATSRRRTSGASASVPPAFHEMGDATSETDMEFDWADETLHAEYGRRWLRALLEARGEDPESWPAVLERCEQLVGERVARATAEDLERIRACADALVESARLR